MMQASGDFAIVFHMYLCNSTAYNTINHGVGYIRILCTVDYYRYPWVYSKRLVLVVTIIYMYLIKSLIMATTKHSQRQFFHIRPV